MNSFGLGLVLNFVDNASSGMKRVTSMFEEMDRVSDRMASSVSGSITDMVTASYALDSVGSTIQGIGLSLVNMYNSVSEQVIASGMSMMGFRARLSALYGDESEQRLQEIKDYARVSVFEVQGLIDAVAMMKTVGIEAMSEVTTSSGKTTQKLLDYASDIAAMVPEMRNMYGTGVEAAMGAIKEYVAEGNAMSLKRGAGLDIVGLLGEKKGGSIEERMRQIADLVEKLNIAGYTKNLEGTPTQQLAKLEDTLYNLKADIADNGVFQTYSNLLASVANWVETLISDTELYNTVVEVGSEVLTAFLTPLQDVVDYLVANTEAITDWIKENPKLIKNILLTISVIGGLTIAFGSLLRVFSSIAMASVGFEALKNLPTVLSSLGGAFTTLITKATPFLALAGLLYYAWEENLFGVRDTALQVTKDLGDIFSLVFDAWDDNTLSEDKFNQAKSMGILPFIESLLQLKYYWGIFVDGFKTGFKSFFDGLSDYLSTFDTFGIDVKGIFKGLGDFLKSFIDVGAEDKWSSLGDSLGRIAGALVVIAVAVNSIKAVTSIVMTVSTFFMGVAQALWFITKLPFLPVIGMFAKIGSAISGLSFAFALVKEFGLMEVISAWMPKLASVIKFVTGIATGIAGFLGISVGWLAVIVAGIVALGVIIYKNWDAIKSFLAKVPDWILNNILIPVRNFFATIFNFLVGIVATFWEEVKSVLDPIKIWFRDNVTTPIYNFFAGLWQGICDIASAIFNSICEFLAPITNWIGMNIITPVLDFFAGLWEGICDIADKIYIALTGAFRDACEFIMGLWQGVKDFFGDLWSQITAWAGDITKKGEGITGIQSSIPHASSGVSNFAGGVIQVNEDGGELINLPNGSTVIPHDKSVQDSFNAGADYALSSLAKLNSGSQPQVSSKVENDFSVTFSAGSIVLQVVNATEAELEKAAEKLMKIIERKQQLNAMAIR